MNINGVRATVPLLNRAQNYVNFYYDFTIMSHLCVINVICVNIICLYEVDKGIYLLFYNSKEYPILIFIS